ncbi:MAG: CooT family nickel-binding protein [Desulfobacterales bacterium]
MCLTTVYLNSVEAENRLMKEVALIEADGDGFWLIDLFGERRFVTGKIQSLDLTNGQCLMARKPAPD